MEIVRKLDEDFIFYMGFVNSFSKHIRDTESRHICNEWLKRLCGEPCMSVHKKRCRNIYLSQLLLCMQSGQLAKEFKYPMHEVDIADALDVFNLGVEEFKLPYWLNECDMGITPPKDGKQGRTYVATRELPDGQGAFAYIAISLEDDEPKWFGGGEGALDRHLERKYREEVPEYEMEKILARRKDPKEREKVVTFYTTLMKSIEDELDEKVPWGENGTINGLLDQLQEDLANRGQMGQFEGLDDKQRRIELMLILHDRIKVRIDKVIKREEILDEAEKGILTKSFFDTSLEEQDKFQLPATMWEQAINKAPNKKHIIRLKENYPLIVIDKFLELLSNHKEEIAMRMQRRHENIAAQMKKELRREDEKGKKMVEESRAACEHALEIMNAVKVMYDKKMEAEERNRLAKEIPKTEQSKLYDQIRAALFDTQKSVEEEAARGRELAAQINVVNEQTEQCHKENLVNIEKIEKANMDIMKNIKRMNDVIKVQQERIAKVQTTVSKRRGGETFDFPL